MELVLTLLGIAAVDALNPATIAEASVLAASRHPVRAVLSYWVGALAVYLAVGLILSFGPADAVSGFLSDPPEWFRVGQIFLGVALCGGGLALWLRRRRINVGGHLAEAPAGMAFGLGAAATVADLPTAFPYFAAVTLVAGAELSAIGELGTLLLYNLVYLLPVLLVLALRLLAAKRADRLLGAVQRGIERWATSAVAVLLLVGGPALAVGGAVALS